MIRTNLSTRPFYNERAVQLVLLGAGLVVLAATLFNVTRILQLSRQDTQLATQAASDEARARDLVASAARRRATVDPRALELASVDARQANDLIDRRTFSWTELFNRFETTAARRGADHRRPPETRSQARHGGHDHGRWPGASTT